MQRPVCTGQGPHFREWGRAGEGYLHEHEPPGAFTCVVCNVRARRTQDMVETT